MTDPISSARPLGLETPASRRAQEDASKPSATQLSRGQAAEPRDDEVVLSAAAQRIQAEPEIDRNKVEAIKAAIAEGRYPLDPRRIAESFMALERMIGNNEAK